MKQNRRNSEIIQEMFVYLASMNYLLCSKNFLHNFISLSSTRCHGFEEGFDCLS